LFTLDRLLLRSALICTVAFAGILYELFKINPPRWLLVAGYGAIVALAMYRIANKPIAQDQHEASNHSE